MANRIVLISDDSDFFDYIKHKLELRKSDELFSLSFDEVPDKIDSLQTSVLIVNSENSNQKTLDLLNIFNYFTPIIVTAYNDDEIFKKKCYRAGMLDFIPLLTPDAEFRARMLPALSLLSILEKNKQYRNILVKNKIISKNNEVFVNYENIIDNTIAEIEANKDNAVFAIITTDEKNKYLLNPNAIETFLLGNLRKDDILMKFAYNKYYMIMYNCDLKSAKKHWNKISMNLQYKLYTGFVEITTQNRQQLINSALTALREEFEISNNSSSSTTANNFKMIRKNLARKLETLITPVFYRIQQKYINRLTGVKIEQKYNNGQGHFNIKGKHFVAEFKISSPGFSKINIDITINKEPDDIETKRITFEPDEFDEGLLEDLLEQFATEIKSCYCQ